MLKKSGRREVEDSVRVRENLEDAKLLAMKMEEGAMSQGMWAAS